MNSRPGTPDPHQMLELRALVAGLCDAELTVAQVARLEEMIRTSAACAAYYVNAMMVYSALPQYVGIERGASGMQLIADWQSRDNEFWSALVPNAAGIHEPTEATLSLPSRDWQAGTQRRTLKRQGWVGAAVEKLSGQHGKKLWLVLTLLTGSVFAILVTALVFNRGDNEVARIAKPLANQPTTIATLTRLRQVRWEAGQTALPVRTELTAGQKLILAAGVAEVTFESGAVTILEGPAEFVVQSPGEGFLHQGRILANVPAAARGFAIGTRDLRVVDLGTEFGVEVDEQQNTGVQVFKGVIEAHLPAGEGFRGPVRVEANRAIRYDVISKSVDSVPLDRGPFDEIQNRLTRPVITEVKASSGKAYRVAAGGMREDAHAYIDRDYQWNGMRSAGIPAPLNGADYVLTSNNDDLDADFSLAVTVTEPATLYVLFDKRAKAPEWLTRDFVETVMDIGLDTGSKPDELAEGPGRSIDVPFSIWKRHVEAGTTTCGPTNQPNVAHYGVAVVAGEE